MGLVCHIIYSEILFCHTILLHVWSRYLGATWSCYLRVSMSHYFRYRYVLLCDANSVAKISCHKKGAYLIKTNEGNVKQILQICKNEVSRNIALPKSRY